MENRFEKYIYQLGKSCFIRASKISKGVIFKGTHNYNSNEKIYYPAGGGFISLFSDSIEKLRRMILLNTEIVSIDLVNKIVAAKNGSLYKYNHLISTVPLDILLKDLIKPIDAKVADLANKLQKVSICLVTFLVAKKISELQRIYVADDKYLAQRVVINSNSSLLLNSLDNSIVSLEISYKHRHKLPHEGAIIDNCKQLLKDLGFIVSDFDIQQLKVDYFMYMYPVQTIGLEDVVAKVQSYLKKYDCYTIGRFGSWNYANIDGIMDEVATLINKNF